MDRIVSKLAMAALLAVCISVLTTAWAQRGETAHAGAGVPMQPDWASSGQNNHNTRSAAAEHTINAGNVGNLKTAWIFTTAGDVSATATVVNGVAYFPDWGGKLWAIDTKTGKAIWSHDVSEYPEPLSRPRGRARHTGMTSWLLAPAT